MVSAKPSRAFWRIIQRPSLAAPAGGRRARGMGDEGRSQRLGIYFVAFVVSCLLLPLWTVQALSQSGAAANSPPADKDAAFQQAIHDYILAHPEVLIESLQRAKLKAEQRQASLISSRIVEFRKDLVDDPNAPVLGNPKGDVTLVEFFDYRCPFCRQVEPWVQTLLKEDPGVRLVQKEFPILGPASVYGAHVALAAWKQGKHTAFHNALMAKEGNMDEREIHEDLIFQVAKSVGLDIDRMKIDMESPDVAAEIQRSMEIARSLRLTGTPAFIVGTVLVPGATDLMTLHEMVDDARHGLN
jgi:protein-disulfide isomerase